MNFVTGCDSRAPGPRQVCVHGLVNPGRTFESVRQRTVCEGKETQTVFPLAEEVSIRIVFADDHNLIRETVGILLTKLAKDVEVVEASTFDEALAKAMSGPPPDLIILDLYMPGMNHLRGVEEMRARFQHVPIVILTGSVDLNDA